MYFQFRTVNFIVLLKYSPPERTRWLSPSHRRWSPRHRSGEGHSCAALRTGDTSAWCTSPPYCWRWVCRWRTQRLCRRSARPDSGTSYTDESEVISIDTRGMDYVLPRGTKKSCENTPYWIFPVIPPVTTTPDNKAL